MAKRQTARSSGTSSPLPPPPPESPIVQTFAINRYLPPDGTPEIFIDGIASLVVLNGVAKFRCFSAGTNPDDHAAAAVVLRLAMALPVVAAVHEFLGRVMNDLKIPSASPPQAQTD
jgi:hypothetical protein